jgi:hypothetical protein
MNIIANAVVAIDPYNICFCGIECCFELKFCSSYINNKSPKILEYFKYDFPTYYSCESELCIEMVNNKMEQRFQNNMKKIIKYIMPLHKKIFTYYDCKWMFVYSATNINKNTNTQLKQLNWKECNNVCYNTGLLPVKIWDYIFKVRDNLYNIQFKDAWNIYNSLEIILNKYSYNVWHDINSRVVEPSVFVISKPDFSIEDNNSQIITYTRIELSKLKELTTE